jgi:Flp pilus assembly protein TadD
MHQLCKALFFLGFLFIPLGSATAQSDEICREAGFFTSLDSPFAQVPYIYGRITLATANPDKPAKITVIYWDREQNESRWTVGKSGYYCFKRNNASGGNLVVEVDGIEVARKNLPAIAPGQLREDFEVSPAEFVRQFPPSTVSAKFSRPANDKTAPLYRKVAEAERDKNVSKVISVLKEIVQSDPQDFVAWAKLGTIYFEQGNLLEADGAFRKSLELRVDYTPAWINVGKLRMAQKQFDAAAEILKHATTLDPANARIFQLLGEAYIQAKKGTLGAEALHKAIELDPVGMADSHLLLARLYQLAGAKDLAVHEYEMFLTKVKDHPERKRAEKFVKENKGT